MVLQIIKYILVLGALITSLSAQVWLADTCNVSFFSEAPLENIEAQSTMPKGSTYAAYNQATGKLNFKIPILSFRFENGLMEEHFNENYMESEKYPYATFKGKLSHEGDSVVAEGVFQVHGVTKSRKLKGVLVKGEKLILKGSFIVITKEHKIKIPKLLVKNIAEEIKVDIYCEFIQKI